jgi:hypothetical protein
MMATPHMVAGAAVGRLLRRPWLAYPAAFASHFLLDFVPHIDSHGLFGADHGGPTRLEAASGVTDFLVGALIVGLVAARHPGRRVMIGSAFFAILMDLAEYVPPFGPWFRSWAGAAWLTGFHHRIQHNLTPAHWELGAATQVAVLGLGLAICLAGRKTTRRTPQARAASV